MPSEPPMTTLPDALRSCATCKRFFPMRVASAMNYAIQRWKPCEVSDFDTPSLPMTQESFVEAIKEYACDLHQSA